MFYFTQPQLLKNLLKEVRMTIPNIPPNEKYFVFKQSDFHQWLNDILVDLSKLGTWEDRYLKDAVVIRLQDIYAAQAFWEYAGNIRSTIDLLDLLGHDVPKQLQDI